MKVGILKRRSLRVWLVGHRKAVVKEHKDAIEDVETLRVEIHR